MISSIFYFADTEQEYLDNFNRRQVKPYTIVFCKDTHSVWKNGVRYGGSTSAETQSLISEIIDRDVAPLIAQLEQAIAQANEALSRAEGRVDEISAGFEDSIRQISAQIDEEKLRLADKVNELDEQVTQSVGDILDDYQNLVNNLDENISNWFDKVAAGEIVHTDGWNEALKAYLTAVETVEVDPETGETTVKTSNLIQDINGLKSDVQEITKDGDGKIAVAKSEVIQKASEIVSQVTGVTVADDGTVNTSNTNLSQQIADNGDAIIDLRSEWGNADKDTKDVLEWMYSGLTTKAGESGTFNDLVSAASSGDHSAISNILSLVEKIPTYQTDPLTGELLEDEHGNYIPVTDNNGNVIYQTNPDGSFKYKAKASLTSAVDNALAGLMTETTADYASSALFAEINRDIAGLKASTGDASALEGFVAKDDFAAELKAVASKDWAETTMATKLRVPKKNNNGDIVYDEQGNVVYEDVADVLGAMRTTIDVLDGGPQVTNSIDAKVNNAISTFEQKVNDGEACTTLVNKVDENRDNISAFVSKVTNDSSEASLATKMNKLSGGVVTNSGLDSAVSALLAKGSNTRSSIYSKVNESTNQAIAAMAVDGGARIVWTEVDPALRPGSDFDVRNYDVDNYYIDIPGDLENPGGAWTIDYFASQINTINDGYLQWVYGQNVKPGDIFEFTNAQYYAITERSFKAGVLSEVDGKIGTAKVGLVAENELTGKVAGILATVGKEGSEITLDADQLNITSKFINAMNAELNVGSVTTELILAALAEGLTIKAGKVNFQKADGSPAPISIDVNDGTLHAENAKLGGQFVTSNDYAEIEIKPATALLDGNNEQDAVSGIKIKAYDNIELQFMSDDEGDWEEFHTTNNSLLQDVVTIGVRPDATYSMYDDQWFGGYDGYVQIKSTISDGRSALFSPTKIALNAGYGVTASLSDEGVRCFYRNRELSNKEKQYYRDNASIKYFNDVNYSSLSMTSGGIGIERNQLNVYNADNDNRSEILSTQTTNIDGAQITMRSVEGNNDDFFFNINPDGFRVEYKNNGQLVIKDVSWATFFLKLGI